MVWKPYPAVHGGYLVLGGLGMSINTSARGRVLSCWSSFSLQLQITNGTTTQEKFGKSCERTNVCGRELSPCQAIGRLDMSEICINCNT